MTRRKILCIAAAALFFLLAAAGCRRDDRALWQILEEQQYNRYKPKLDYMVKKYGDMFEMDVYGTVYCTEPEYKDWSLGVTTGSDNFAVRLRRDELEQFMYKIAQPVLGGMQGLCDRRLCLHPRCKRRA